MIPCGMYLTHSHPNIDEDSSSMSIYIPLFQVDVITYPCPNLGTGLAIICW